MARERWGVAGSGRGGAWAGPLGSLKHLSGSSSPPTDAHPGANGPDCVFAVVARCLRSRLASPLEHLMRSTLV